MKARIKVITAEAKTNLNNAQSRLEEVQRQAETDKERFKVELTGVQNITKQITIERDDLFAKIEQLTNVNKPQIVDWEVRYILYLLM